MADNQRLGANFTIDVSDLKAGLAQANRMIRESESEFKAAAAGMDDWGNSADGLNARIKHLTTATDLQRKKVDALQKEYNRLVDNGMDETSKAATELRTKINQEQAALNKNEKELKNQTEALKHLGDESAGAAKDVEKLERQTNKSSTALSGLKTTAKVAVKALMAIGAAATAAAGAFSALVVKSLKAAGELEQNLGGSEAVFGKYAESMQKTAENAYKNMGLSQSDFLATANKMGALFKGSGFSLEESATISAEAMQRAADVASIMGIDVSSAMESIAGAAKGNFTMMDNLGVAMNDTTLNAYALEKGLEKTTSQMTTQEKIALAMQMFLEKTAYAAGNYAKENETLAGALTTAKAAFKNFLSGTGSVDDIVDAVLNAANVIADNLDKIVPRLSDGVIKLVEKLAPKLPPIIERLLPTILQAALGLIDGISKVLPSIVLILVNLLPKVADLAVQILETLVNALLNNAEQIATAAVQIVLALAQGLTKMIPTLIPAIINAVILIYDTLLDNIDLIIKAGTELLTALADGILLALPILIENIPYILDRMLTALINGRSDMINAGVNIVLSLIVGILQSLPQLIVAVAKIIGVILKSFGTYIVDMGKVGKNLVIGLWDGIKSMGSWIGDKIKGFGKGILNGIKNTFGIHSPSTVFRDEIGKNLALGIGEGFEDNIRGVNATISRSVSKLTPTAGNSINGAYNGVASPNSINVTQNITYNKSESRADLFKTRQATKAAVRLVMAGG